MPIGGHPADIVGIPLQTGKDLADLVGIAGASRIEPHPAPRPVEEFTVEERFQTGNLPADGPFR